MTAGTCRGATIRAQDVAHVGNAALGRHDAVGEKLAAAFCADPIAAPCGRQHSGHPEAAAVGLRQCLLYGTANDLGCGTTDISRRKADFQASVRLRFDETNEA